MTSLHAFFHNRDQAAFQRHLQTALPIHVNARDFLGRTVLHLASTSTARAATEYVRLLLAHPAVNVNLQDTESHWTALHRALYHGNITAAYAIHSVIFPILLLKRSEIDTSLKDFEGYRAFDVYNTTVEDTMPNKRASRRGLELYTWGTNRNASLGHGDTNDRSNPEQVVLMHRDVSQDDRRAQENIYFKLQPARVRDAQMSRLHTDLVLAEDNTRNPHSYRRSILRAYLPPSLWARITRLPLHLTAPFSRGVLSILPAGVRGTPPPHVQSSPRAIAGPLRRERVRGIAACKSASACWTDTEYTPGERITDSLDMTRVQFRFNPSQG
ncbi:hypothetical protein F5148DRAFT_1149969 [Russula earlei]|uniref:Uncharacterized protein n=1 Tax=Russula earlei TaxID=71964 RepID=A0ACC0U743_9AGAM|nr:hypothetical protein F5148DRAFT_1149969 [Russula earlei]